MKIKTSLMDHQKKAVEKLSKLRVGALYMEMGTGKTRTALEMIHNRLASGKIDHVLWLCPCSVRQSLKDDISYHADGALTKIAVYGIESLSSSIRLYELLMRYVSAGTTMLVVDESNLVKNYRAIRTRRITALAEKCRYRLILNGTPVSRNEADLFSQWYILDWRILGYRSFWSFSANHLEYDPDIPGKVRRTLNTDYLIEKIAPYSFQISKEECFTLPKKNYDYQLVRLSSEQDKHYDDVVDRMIEMLDERQPETIYKMFSVAQAIISGLYVDISERHVKTSPMFKDPLDNPRIKALIDVVEDIPQDEKIIIFAKYTHEILTIVDVLGAIPFYGGISKKHRQENLELFKGTGRILVANKTCAGYGLNLQCCHNVIYYSNDWDWATRAQSEDRVHRYGQAHDVKIIDVEAYGTLDSKILRCLSRKEKLTDLIKREIHNANSVDDAKGTFRKWLKGELEDGKDIHNKKCV